jgi:[ribosomal protein S5]-alanine N-acetyltransferase
LIPTRRTILRPYTGTETPLVLPIFSDPTTMSFWPEPLDEETVATWIERNARSFETTGLGRMMVEDRETGAIVGDCGIMRAEIDGRMENDLGYIIHHPYWGAGLATECALACLQYGVSRLGLRRVVANMPHDHVASIRVAERLGMALERTFSNSRNRDIPTHLYVYEAGATP